MFKDNTQFRERFNRWKLGELVYDKGRPIDPPEVELPTVVVTPDYEYNLYAKGKDDDPIIPAGMLKEVVVTAPRRYFKEYDNNGNPVYTSNYRESLSYLNSFLPKGDIEKRRERWYALNVGSNGQQRPGLHGYAADVALAAEIGIGGALAPLFFAPIVAGAAGAAPALAPGSAFWINPLTRQIVTGMAASTAVDAGSKVITGNTWGENIAGGIKDVTGWDPRNSIYTSWIPDATNPGWFMNPTRVLNTVNSTVQGTKKGILFLNSPKGLGEPMAPEVTHFYHGSPVRFDTFSADFIGSGEGGSKVMRGINLWPVEKIGNAPKFANIKSPDAPLHLGVSSTPLGGELNPTVYDVSGRGLKLYTTTSRGVKDLSQSDLISQGYDGIQTPNQVTVFPESISKLSIDKQSSIEDFVMSHPEVERWTPWTTDSQKMQNIIDRGRMSRWTPEQWTVAQDAAIARGDMAEAQRLRDLHFIVSAPNTVASVNGQPLQLYHGTDATFNAFDISKYGSTDGGTFGRGVYTTPIKEYAKLYGKNNMPLYMKLDNPRDYRNSSIGDLIAEKIAFGDDFATGIGIDGVVGRPSWNGFKGLEEYVSHNSKNIKSSLPVTYDDNGVRIPLGKRDNFNINDIRYSLIPWILGGGTAATLYNNLDGYKNGKDSIHIKPSKRGTFTKAAKSHGMSVQGFASKVLANKDNYSSAMVKKANFARNARKFKH